MCEPQVQAEGLYSIAKDSTMNLKPAKSAAKKGRLSLKNLIHKLDRAVSSGDRKLARKAPPAAPQSTARENLVMDTTQETMVVPDTNYFAYMFPDTNFSDGPK